MLEDILIPFITICLAELGDKTQLSIFLLSSQTRKHLELLLGIILAFLIVDGIAILFGESIGCFIPEYFCKILSGIIFIFFGILSLIGKEKEIKSKYRLKSPFYSGFILIFLAELGDKTQIASGLLAIKYNGLMVLIGATTALFLLSIIAIYLGKIVSRKINERKMEKIVGFLFILIGISFFLF